MKIVLVRHGQTDANLSKVMQTALDTGLNETGVRQVNDLGVHLNRQNFTFDKIYSSPLRRARQTAEILSQHVGGGVEVETSLREISFGNLEGASKEIFVELEFGYNSERMMKAGGETVHQVAGRIKFFLEKLAASSHKNVMCVGHGLALSVFAQILLGEELTFANIHAHMNADFSQFDLNMTVNDGAVELALLEHELFVLNGRPAF